MNSSWVFSSDIITTICHTLLPMLDKLLKVNRKEHHIVSLQSDPERPFHLFDSNRCPQSVLSILGKSEVAWLDYMVNGVKIVISSLTTAS